MVSVAPALETSKMEFDVWQNVFIEQSTQIVCVT